MLIDRAGQVVTGQDVAAFKDLPLVVGAGAPAASAELIDALTQRPALQARVVAAVRVGERRWNLRLRGGVDVLLPEEAEPAALDRLMSLQTSVALLDRSIRTVDLRLLDRLVISPTAPGGGPPGSPSSPPEKRARLRRRSQHDRHRRGHPMNDMASRRTLALPPAMAPDEPTRVRAGRAGPFGVLDIGTTKIVCLIGRVEGDGTLRVLGFGWQKGRGVRGGGITDLEEAERAIRACVGQAEDMADTRLRSVTVNLSCGQPESRLFNVQWQMGGVGGPGRPVDDHDVRRVVHEGRARAALEGRDTIHAIPLSFVVDELPGVLDPRGLHCVTLNARLHVVDAATTALRSLGACIARCDLDISELVSAPMAAGLATLVADERELGATVIDMGGGTTNMAIFSEGQLLHTAQLAVGGVHVTNDLARLLSTPVAHAERLKTLYGNAQASPDDEREMLPVPLVGEDEHQIAKVPRSMIVNIIRPRLEETFEMVRERIDQSGLSRAAGTRVVLTGGACQLGGAREMAHAILGRQVRLGRPQPLRGLPDSAAGPAFATAAGLLAWAAARAARCTTSISTRSGRPACSAASSTFCGTASDAR